MTWEYLETANFDIRYQKVANYLPNTSQMDILDLNCGQAGLRRYIPYWNYFGNDLIVPHNIGGMWFAQIKDIYVNIPCDVLCCFGMTTGKTAEHPLESETAPHSVVRLAEYRPRFVVLEACWECEDALWWIHERLPEMYVIRHEDRFDLGATGQFYDKRHILILERT